MTQDTNNLLQKYGIKVRGSDGRVDVESNANSVKLIFTDVCTIDAMEDASKQISKALPERLKGNVTFGVTGGCFTVSMSKGTYQELTGNKVGGAKAL
jgi:hypothetical protein